jgi:outer membrane protein OmpA-like peptidoglycan-associated protein
MTIRSSTSALAFAGTLTLASVATANPTIEIGGALGVHGFSDTNELGVFDEMGAASLSNSFLFGLRLGVIFNDLIGVEGEATLLPTSVRDMGDLGTLNTSYRGHLIAQYSKLGSGKVVPFLVGGISAFHVASTDDAGVIYQDTDPAWYGGIGAKYRLPKGWGLRGDARLYFPPSSENEGVTTDFELVFSFYKEFGRRKTDDDPDRDGIRGLADKCPNDPEDKDGFEDADGCPDLDNDKDGIADASDKCPMDPEDKDGFQDDDGCPDNDNDNDGIADASDKCPTDPEDKDGFEDEDGCPDTDNDKDGIADAKDKCPNEPETVNSFEDEDGCPDTVPVAVKKFTGVIEGITFQTSSSTILAVSNAKLDEAVKVLTEYPTLKMEIHGHTDDQPVLPGSPFADNQALSQARAEAVKGYLVKKGVAADRLEAKGFGDSKPIVSVTDPEGKPLKGAALNNARAKNRRVEFHPVP